VTHVPVHDFDDPRGIPYFEGSTYLLLCDDGKGHASAQVLFLPDPNKKREVRVRSFFSTVDVKLGYENGILTSATETVDSTAVVKSIVNAAGKILGELAAISGDPRKSDGSRIALYKVEVEGSEVRFVGKAGQAVAQVAAPRVGGGNQP